MKTPTALITGVGAIIGQGIIKSLRREERPVRIVGIDRNPDAFGARGCDRFHPKPLNEEGAGYLDFLKRVIRDEGVDLVLPGIEHDVFYFDAHRDDFAGLGVALALNHHELIETARDKWKTTQILGREGFEVIPTRITGSWSECVAGLGKPPLLLKPRQGNGARKIVRLDDERDFEYWTRKMDEAFMLQRIVGTDDDEFTASVFGLGNGQATPPIIFRRKLSATGSTLSAEVVDDASIQSMIGRLNALFRPLGPTNYQFRTEAGTVYLLEINPRISSATSFRAAFGFNEAWMCVDYFVHKTLPAPRAVRKGRATRYVEDHVEYS